MYIIGNILIDTDMTGNNLAEWSARCEITPEQYAKISVLLDRVVDIINDEPSETKKVLRCVKPTPRHSL